MANLRRPSSKDKDIVGRFKPDGRCKKHPKHRQSPGVCSLCLREKLTQVSSCRTTSAAVNAGSSSPSSVSSLSSCYSSSSASSCSSPAHRLRFVTKGKGSSSVSIVLLSGKHGLLRSRSMAVVPRRRDGEGGAGVDHGHSNSTKKSGFWFKLLHPKSKRKEEKDTKLIHSMSVREMVTIAS